MAEYADKLSEVRNNILLELRDDKLLELRIDRLFDLHSDIMDIIYDILDYFEDVRSEIRRVCSVDTFILICALRATIIMTIEYCKSANIKMLEHLRETVLENEDITEEEMKEHIQGIANELVKVRDMKYKDYNDVITDMDYERLKHDFYSLSSENPNEYKEQAEFFKSQHFTNDVTELKIRLETLRRKFEQLYKRLLDINQLDNLTFTFFPSIDETNEYIKFIINFINFIKTRFP